MIRPESIFISQEPASAGANRARGFIEGTIILGNLVRHDLRLRDGSALACVELNRSNHPAREVGTEVELWW